MIHFSTYKHRQDAKNGVLYKLTVEECIEKFFARHVLNDHKDSMNFNLGHYENPWKDSLGIDRVHRIGDNIKGVYGIGFDIDNTASIEDESIPPFTIAEAKKLFEEYTYVIYTTHSHMSDGKTPKFRIVLFFDRMLEKERYADVWNHLRKLFPENNNVDPSAKDVARFWYLPRCPVSRGNDAKIKKQMKKLIDVDKLLKELDLATTYRNLDDISTDQRFATIEPKIARSTPIYTTEFPEVNKKITIDDQKINLTTLTTSLTNINDNNNDVYERVSRVLSEPQMHVSNFTGNSYNDWITIGSAIKGAGLPFDLFDRWSSMDAVKYTEAGGSQGLLKRWNGFNGTATEGSIFEIAKQRNVAHWLGHQTLTLKKTAPVSIKQPEPEEEDAPISMEEAQKLYKPREEEEKIRNFPLELCYNAPEPYASYINYVLETNPFPNPVFALANAISTFGALNHQRIQHEYMLCGTNMYVVTLALSGQGKSHAFKCTRYLFEALGLSDQIANVPQSTSGLITGMRSRQGSLFLLIDELEKKLLQPMTSKSTSAHFQTLSGEFMNLYSASYMPYSVSNLFADEEKNKRQTPIPNPHLSIYGACVNDDFYKYYTGDLAENGFLARIMPFANTEFLPEQKRDYKDVRDVPKKLLDICRKILAHDPHSGLAELSTAVRPIMVTFDSENTKNFHLDCTEVWRRKGFAKSQEGKNKVAAIYNRVCENALKIALPCHVNYKIDRDVWKWALNVATTITEIVINNAVENMPENPYDSKVRRIEKIIASHGGWIAHSEVTAKFRDTEAVRKDILNYLIESGRITSKEVLTSHKAKKAVKMYMAL